MSMAVGGKGASMHDINVTPLIDVLLVLIIIFMVINPPNPNGLDALVPQPNKEKQQNEDIINRTIVVQMDAQRQLKINQDPVQMAQLGAKLEDIFKTRNQRIIFVKGDPSLTFGEVAQVIDIAKGAGIDKIGLLTQKMEEGQ
jgi:biopolymer transport protein TolR